ncbi:ATP phosphoribosyltransferase regulatory subunit [Xinfangfangia sp. D13-10-4-6]|uniref:ATP phosphoribosyltransferase regulatory subunit n=1 Tax=Pseudogemmobacter hezensis TaxID=2737662 RepID=UPI0015564E53|nr:ATP phosphoribosyltransferase regulatory subunit [Pseudogemmobacter hezensis]NPD15502.1 ATP phosphoribosyltransferase regulatory subunit [Pseudogemmobacter hezensis]
MSLTASEKAGVRAVAEELYARFLATGAAPVETDILQPAGTLLDLYGEDIRARAYVTADPGLGEMMLRPDFTVPVVQAHMRDGAEPARYAYMGEVFRRQEDPQARAREYLQVGFEVFDRAAPAADAEVFALFSDILAPLKLRPATGDIGILMAAVRGLSTSDRRKAALLRHIWRPRRFRALLDRFAGRAAPSPARAALLSRLKSDAPAALVEAAGPLVGLRSAEDIAERATALIEDAQTPPIAAPEAALLYDLLNLQAPALAALAHLRGIAPMLPAITPAIDTFAARLEALQARGVDVANLPFEASHGRTTLEYYDGFVFTLTAGDANLPAIASGGRYDALTAQLGQGGSIPAVGGIIRPELVARLRGDL